MDFAESDGRVVVTHDLDFGALLAATRARGPSVVLIRTTDVMGATIEALVLAALAACDEELTQGAIVTIDEAGHRVRALPLIREPERALAPAPQFGFAAPSAPVGNCWARPSVAGQGRAE